MKNENNKKLKKLSTVLRSRLLKVSAVILLCSILLIFAAVMGVVRISTSKTLESQISELCDEVNDNSDSMFGSLRTYVNNITAQINKENIDNTMYSLMASNWYYIDKDGIVKYTDDSSMLNKKASSDPELDRFSDIISGEVKDYKGNQPIPTEEFRSKNWKKYVICDYGEGGHIVLKYEPKDYYRALDGFVDRMCNYETVGTSGKNLIIHQNGDIVSPDAETRNELNIKISSVDADKMTSLSDENIIFPYDLNGKSFYAMYSRADGYYAISLIPKSDVMTNLSIIMMITGFLVLLLLTVIFLRMDHLMNKLVVKNIKTVNSELSEITSGNLETQIDVRNNLEFDELSNGINSTVDTLKGYIARESERFEQELELARAIQTSALPGVFPPFPDRHDIDIFATMKPAKQVGGDFYDFFFVDDAHFVFLTADVSDKGIPAAMFMMKAKTIIKSLALSNRDIEKVIKTANRTLCEDNSADMFVTLWIGALNTLTGELSYINSGHCRPLLKRSDDGFEFLSDSPDFVVAIEEDVSYHCRKLTLKKGDMMFLYTDGVTEAVNSGDKMYGEDRLKETLNKADVETADEICACVSDDISEYTRNATQSDDITMLAVVYNGRRIFEEMTVDAELMQLEGVYSFIKQQLRSCGFDSDSIAQFSIIADEICANIVRYAYPGGGGKLTVGYSFDPASNDAALTFTDEGIPFNPLKAPDPDLEDPEEREEGGLGLFLVRRFSDRLQYEYSNGKNILTITKRREP